MLKVVGRVLSGESAAGGLRDAAPLTTEFGRDHLRLLTDKLSDDTGNLRIANARLRALINIGLELASARDSDHLLESVCMAARDLFGATYVTLGIVDRHNRAIQRLLTCGADGGCDTRDADWIGTGETASGILGAVVAERRLLRGANRDGDPGALQLPALHPEAQSFLVAPITSPAHVYGWMCLVGNEGKTFSDEDEALLMALAGQVGRIYELEHEIVDRKQAEATLRDERDRAQRYLDTPDVILLALDTAGRITLVNRYACAVLGWPAEELLGRDWTDTCLPVRVRETLRAKFHDLIAGDLSARESLIMTRSGAERVIKWRNTVLRDAEGDVIGTFSSGADITERREAVEELRTAEERMRFALEAADVGTWDMDPATGAVRWSAILEAQYGLPPGAFGGTYEAAIERVHPDDRASVIETVEAAMKSGADFSIQNRSVGPDGAVRWLNGAGRFHLGADGRPVRGAGISLDVTERRTLEEQVRQAQKMEVIGRLAGGVAHDFNNLLTVILGHCELLLADLDPGDQREADIVEIQKAGASAAGLTSQLLAFSRKQIIEPTILDVNVIVSDMRAMLGRLIREDVNVVMNLRPGLARVKADRGQVEQIVLNLAVNARDAMPAGGTLSIETANVRLDEHYAETHLNVTPGRYVALTVTDSGAGMTPQVQARLFEPFFTTKEVGKGAGLGLATVHGIMARCGGSVAVYSEVDRGTCFKVYFPRSDEAEPVVVDTPPPVWLPRVDAHTVLVVEDEKGLRELAGRLLLRLGYTVLAAGNADEAVRLFEQNESIDVLLTDIVMPGASGPELTRRLIAQRPALKVVYMSGHTEEAVLRHGALDPGTIFLHKPFSSESLGEKIREVLDREWPA